MLMLKSAPKGYTLDTHRVRAPEETLLFAKEPAKNAGITRVAEITGLDRLGIPVFTSIRPRAAEGAVTVYNGKGFTPKEAEVSAIMEGIERYSAEPAAETVFVMENGEGNDGEATEGLSIFVGNFGTVGKAKKALDPTRLILPSLRGYSYGEDLEWVSGTSITGGGEVLVPSEAVFHPYRRPNQLFKTNTNGLAAGNVVEEAVVHGLMEVVERDAWSLFEVNSGKARDIEYEGTGFGPIKDILGRLEAASVRVYLKDITSDIGITTVAAAIDDEATRDAALLSLGVGTHLVPEIAALRALTEAVQSRLTTIHGTREDTFKAEFARRIGYDRMKRINKRWFTPSEGSVRIGELARYESCDFLDDIKHTVKKLGDAGLDEVIAVDLTRRETGVPVVRVVVPGLEVYAMDRDRAGERLRRAMQLNRNGEK